MKVGDFVIVTKALPVADEIGSFGMITNIWDGTSYRVKTGLSHYYDGYIYEEDEIRLATQKEKEKALRSIFINNGDYIDSMEA